LIGGPVLDEPFDGIVIPVVHRQHFSFYNLDGEIVQLIFRQFPSLARYCSTTSPRPVAAVAEEPSLPERKVETPPVVVVMRAVDLNKNESRPQDQETIR